MRQSIFREIPFTERALAARLRHLHPTDAKREADVEVTGTTLFMNRLVNFWNLTCEQEPLPTAAHVSDPIHQLSDLTHFLHEKWDPLFPKMLQLRVSDVRDFG